MKKTVEIECVGIQDIHEIIEDAAAAMQLGHYVSVKLANRVGICEVLVYIMLGKWDSVRQFDYIYNFFATDSSFDVNEMNRCKNTLKNLLV